MQELSMLEIASVGGGLASAGAAGLVLNLPVYSVGSHVDVGVNVGAVGSDGTTASANGASQVR